jgi:hypothetical protein
MFIHAAWSWSYQIPMSVSSAVSGEMPPTSNAPKMPPSLQTMAVSEMWSSSGIASSINRLRIGM